MIRSPRRIKVFRIAAWLRTLTGCLPAFLLFIAGCSKSGGHGGRSTLYYPATLTEDKSQTGVGHTSARYSFAYDGSHRLLRKSADFDPGMRSVYAYSTGAYTEDNYVNDSLATHTTYLLNSDNLVDSLYQIDIPDNDTLAAHFDYNDNKLLVRQIQYYYTAGYGSLIYNNIAYVYDSTGNLVTASDGYKVISYTYPGNNFNAVATGLPYPPQNPLLPDMVTTAQSDGTVTSAGHVYTYNAQDQLVTDAVQQSDGTSITRTFTY